MPKRIKTLTPEEQEMQYFQMSLRDCRESYISEPTIFYNVGDRVQRGAWQESYILEIKDEGKIYLVKNTSTKPPRWKDDSPKIESRTDYVAWYNLLPYRNHDQWKNIPLFHDFHYFNLNYMQQDISGLFTYHYHFGVDYDVDYQRPLVWNLKDKQDLIHSIFNHADIGKFVFIQRPFKENQKGYEMLDGKQRMNALTEFYECRFDYCGKFYRELHPRDQGYFDSYPVSVAQMKDITQKQKYDYFLRLNVSGVPQDKKHLEYVAELFKKESK